MNNKPPFLLRRSALFVCCLILTVIFPTPTWGAVSDYLYTAPVTVQNNTTASLGAYALFDLSDEVLSQTQTGSPDMRIYTGNEEIPYAIITGQDTVLNPSVQPTEILNQGQDSQGNLLFEIMLQPNRWVNRLQLITSDQDFIRQVQVEGSWNQKEWVVLEPASTIFDLTSEHKSRHTEVNLTKTNYTYLRVTIYNEGKGLFHLTGVTLTYLDQLGFLPEPKDRPSDLSLLSNTNGLQEYQLDLRYSGLPCHELEISTNDGSFSRNVELFSSENTQDWNLIASGELYSYPLNQLTARQQILSFSSHSRYLKLKIHNGDNLPLNITDITVRGRNPSLVFALDQAKEYDLYWGNNQMKAPLYDIEKFKNTLDYAKMTKVTLGHATENKTYQFEDSRPWSEKNSWLLKIALVVVVMVLLVVIVRSIRKLPRQE